MKTKLFLRLESIVRPVSKVCIRSLAGVTRERMHFCVHRYLGVAGARVQTSVRLATERTLSFFREKIRGRQEKDAEIEDGVAEDGQQQRSGSQVDQGEPRAQQGGEDDSANTLIAVAEAEGAGL